MFSLRVFFSYGLSALILCLITISAQAAPLEDLKSDIHDLIMKQHNASGAASTTVLIRLNGNNIYRNSLGMTDVENKIKATPEYLYGIGSITKPIVAASILKLIDDGDLSLSTKVGEIRPEYDGPAKIVTIYQLLTHTSGVYDFPYSPDFINDGLGFTSEKVISLFKDKPLDFTPGTEWRYSNSGYYLLGLIIEGITKKSLDAALQDLFLSPIGAHHTIMNWQGSIIPKRADGYILDEKGALKNDFKVDANVAFSAGALISSVDDLALIAESSWARDTLAKHIKPPLQVGVPAIDDQTNSTYLAAGLFYDYFQGHEKYYHSGRVSGFQSHMSYYPDLGLTIIILRNTVNAVPDHVNLDQILSQLILKFLEDKKQ